MKEKKEKNVLKEPQNVEEKKKEKFSLALAWKNPRSRSVIISAGMILVCAIVYVVLLFTVLAPEEAISYPTVGNHGESMQNGRPFLYDPLEVDQVQSIVVDNDKGGFTFYRGEDDEFYFEGAEHMFYSSTSDWLNPSVSGETDLSDVVNSVSITESLMFTCRYMLAMEEIVDADTDLSVYGLDGDGKAKMTIRYRNTDDTEGTYTVYFGMITPSHSSYYVRLEGRDAVYIMSDTAITRCIFADVKDYFEPQVAPYVSSTVYSDVAKFELIKKGETFVKIVKLSDEEFELNDELYTHKMLIPDGFFPDAEHFQSILEKFMVFSGNRVVEWNFSEKLDDPEQADEITKMFQLYSLMDPDKKWNHQLKYSYDDPAFDVELYISERLEVVESEDEAQGEEAETKYIYYVYSPAFDCIVEFDSVFLDWIEWDLLSFMDGHAFALNIDSTASIHFQYSGVDVKYSLTGEQTELKITSSTGVAIDTGNFRQLYKAILYMSNDGYAVMPTDAKEILSLKIVQRNGTEYDYKFYGMTDRKAFYTLNGEGQFYVHRDYVKQLIYACNGILAGEEITVEKKN